MLLWSVIFLLLSIVGVNSDIEDDVERDIVGTHGETALEANKLPNVSVTVESVTYYLFTKYNWDKYIQLEECNLHLLQYRKLVFFIHGWTNSRQVPWYENLKNAFLANYDEYFVVQVDWSGLAQQVYHASAMKTFDVGKTVAEFIRDLTLHHQVRIKNILLVGHSLGGHVTGFVGKYLYNMTGEKLPRIIALDPAGPLFARKPADERLNSTDAEIVEVIHTDGGMLGFKDVIGTIDFFPNGGRNQPGCRHIDVSSFAGVADPLYCDHHRAYDYFIETILHPNGFLAKKCADWDSYKAGKCNETKEIAMGNLRTTASGAFFLETNDRSPFSKTYRDELQIHVVFNVA